MNTKPAMHELFEHRSTYPDVDAQDRLARLVGLDDHKLRLTKILSLLVNPASLEAWARSHHPGADQLLTTVLKRPPLIVLAGDVGSGKTELAETIGDAIARQEKIDVTLLPLSLSTRGQGRVGEMTQLLSAAFEVTVEEARKLKSSSGRSRGGVILLVDEADALAQSRETALHAGEGRSAPRRQRVHPRCRLHRQESTPCGGHHVHQPARGARPGRQTPRCGHSGVCTAR